VIVIDHDHEIGRSPSTDHDPRAQRGPRSRSRSRSPITDHDHPLSGWLDSASVLVAIQAKPPLAVLASLAAWTASARAAVGLGRKDRAHCEARWSTRSTKPVIVAFVPSNFPMAVETCAALITILGRFGRCAPVGMEADRDLVAHANCREGCIPCCRG